MAVKPVMTYENDQILNVKNMFTGFYVSQNFGPYVAAKLTLVAVGYN